MSLRASVSQAYLSLKHSVSQLVTTLDRLIGTKALELSMDTRNLHENITPMIALYGKQVMAHELKRRAELKWKVRVYSYTPFVLRLSLLTSISFRLVWTS